MKKTGLYGYVFDFSVDSDGIDVDEILDFQKYLMEKHDIKHDVVRTSPHDLIFNSKGHVLPVH